MLNMMPSTAVAQGFGNFESGLLKGSIEKFIDDNKDASLVVFIGLIINIITGLIIVVGVISIVIGGYLYMTAGGDAGRVSQAKVWISSALVGIILALTAYLILNTLSPQFVPEQDPF